jgi:DNA-binding response OmpR family regulator
MRFSICRRYGQDGIIEHMRVLLVEDEPFMAGAIRDGLRLGSDDYLTKLFELRALRPDGRRQEEDGD